MVQWLLPANSRFLAALAALTALSACATAPDEQPAEVPTAGWRVVERVGEARYSPPDAVTWLAVITGRPIAEGSEVTTGRGGRLIVATSNRHISVGPASRFVLPHPDWNDRLEQRAGWLRYRMANAADAPFRVHTRSLDLEFTAAVIDVRVEQGATEVTVKEGEVRLATPDGLRRTEIATGQSARAGGFEGVQLAVRGALGKTLEPVEPLIVPAVHPTPPTDPVADRPPLDRTAVEPEATLPARPDHAEPEISPAPHDRDATAIVPADAAWEVGRAGPPAVLLERTAAQGAAGPGPRQATPSPAIIPATDRSEPPGAARGDDTGRSSMGRRGKFERLTAGMIDDVQPFPLISDRP
jgi:hypothetical protein